MSTAPGVSVVVVAYGHADDLARCLRPLAGAYPVLVVDNSRNPECAAAAAATGASYVASDRNIGFAAAVNRALETVSAAGDHVLLLNPDAVVEPPTVARLAQVLTAPGNERVAAVAPRQVDPHGAEQRVAWPFPSPGGAWANAVGLGRHVRTWRFLVGSVLLLRHEALADVGRFDERFFLYAEESDWQWRAHRRGWTVELCADVVAHHAGAGTSTDPVVREALFHSSAEALLRKWYGPLGWHSARVATVAGALARAVWRRGEARRQELARARLYARGPHRAALTLDRS